MELCQATKTSKKKKRVIRRWHLDRLRDDEVKLRYQNALWLKFMDFQRVLKIK